MVKEKTVGELVEREDGEGIKQRWFPKFLVRGTEGTQETFKWLKSWFLGVRRIERNTLGKISGAFK